MNDAESGPWLTPLWRAMFLALEFSGAGIILWCGVPFYRNLLAGDFNHSEPFVKRWAMIAVVLIQVGYWARYRHRSTPVLPRRILLGHTSLFLARLNFIFAGGVYSAVFFSCYDQVRFSPGGTGLLFLILFSMFCVTFDIERIGTAYLKGGVPSESPESR